MLSVRSNGDVLSFELHNTLDMNNNNLASLLHGNGYRPPYLKLWVPQLPWRESEEICVTLSRASLEILKWFRVLQVSPYFSRCPHGQALHSSPDSIIISKEGPLDARMLLGHVTPPSSDLLTPEHGQQPFLILHVRDALTQQHAATLRRRIPALDAAQQVRALRPGC